MRSTLIACNLIVSAFVPAAKVQAANVSEFLDFSLRSGSSTLLPGRLYVPPEAATNPHAPRPLVLFLHGGGSRGTDNVGQLHHDINLLFDEVKRRGAFLLAPQAPLNWRPKTVTDRVMTMIDRAVVDHNVDPTRLYLTGYSSGGGGTWNMLSRYPDRFAAAVPVAPVSAEPDFAPANLVGQPIMAFHARNDGIASVNTTRTVINRILTTAGRAVPKYPAAAAPDFTFSVNDLDLHYIEPAAGDHSVLFNVYNRPELYDWMFAHSLVPEPAASGLMVGACVALCHRRRAALRRS